MPWLGDRREDVSRSGLGWAGGNGPLLPAVKQGCQRLVHFRSPFSLCLYLYGFISIFILSLFYEMRTSQVVFIFPPGSHRTTANGSRAKAWGLRLAHFAAVA